MPANRSRRRPLRGGRGLKRKEAVRTRTHPWSPPAWGAWIETLYPSVVVSNMSPPAWGAWIETACGRSCSQWTHSSPPAWGAWIETWKSWMVFKCRVRRPLRGGRGLKPRYGSVPSGAEKRRPLRGGRGLKQWDITTQYAANTSPPAWGAWIETLKNSM